MSEVIDSNESFALIEFERVASQDRLASFAGVEKEGDTIRVVPQSGLPLQVRAGVPVPVSLEQLSSTQLACKRAMDVVLSLMALLMLAPLLLIVAALVKGTSAGPVFFRQDREGVDGKLFGALKFRSMRTESCDLSGVKQTEKNDPRVTPIGRFIRRTSIDELPQLLNVLRGEMSLVGPRPHVAEMLAAGQKYKTLVPYYNARLVMRPGLTGWAQANGWRGITQDAHSARARIDHDIAYIQNFSVMLDLRIMVQTVAREFVTGSAD